jgi:ketosteroid isomerase-like protein
MSEENVEIVRRLFAEWERGNFWTGDYFDPDVRVTWVDPILAPRPETRGIAELTEGMVDFLGTWDRLTATAEEVIDAGDRVVTVELWRGRGKASRATTEVRQGSVLTISRGKVRRMVVYRDPADALEAAGLSE